MDLNRAMDASKATSDAVDDLFEYHKWDEEQTADGKRVRESLSAAVKVIMAVVPPCPDRSVAIRKIREARMDCNSAISHRGKY